VNEAENVTKPAASTSGWRSRPTLAFSVFANLLAAFRARTASALDASSTPPASRIGASCSPRSIESRVKYMPPVSTPSCCAPYGRVVAIQTPFPGASVDGHGNPSALLPHRREVGEPAQCVLAHVSAALRERVQLARNPVDEFGVVLDEHHERAGRLS
jgi:hypothetical protein